jgi:5-(carboxyamino)imidazole ribonucleotide synthase
MNLAPGSVIGILGAGQLGRMLAVAGAKLGLRTHVYAPDADAPADDVVRQRFVGSYDDFDALARFAEGVDVITYEFESVPAEAVEFLATLRTVRPRASALRVAQDRLSEKSFLSGLGLATAPFRQVDDARSLATAVAALGTPAILKTRRFGYDGKGQARIDAGADLGAVSETFRGQPCILEGFVPFDREASIIAGRSSDGVFAAYDLCENEHKNHILASTRLPARVSPGVEVDARAMAQKILEALDYVGVMGIEFFIARDAQGLERLVVNELAPRVHNSGHWTIEGAATSQFEQHLRAVAGWPLGSTRRFGPIEMINLVGDEVARWPQILADPSASLHLYGKVETRPGRKMGHVTWVR